MMESTGMARRTVQAEEMLPLLKRHEIQVLLRAGHSQADVSTRTGVSAETVRRVKREAEVTTADDTAARRERKIGRPSKATRSMKRVGSIALRVLAGAFALTAGSRSADANIGAPWQEGEVAGDPVGVHDVAITHEELIVDMRPLVTGAPLAVSATYELDNAIAAKELDLLFASGASDLADVRITLDGRPIASRPEPHVKLPPEWRAPSQTPALDERRGSLGLKLVDATPVAFHLSLPTGRHRLSVTYAVHAALRHVGDLAVVRQFAYVLAPARTWQSFGRLDVTVQLPRGWRAAVTPSLARDGDRLRGSFEGVPADAIALTVQAPFVASSVVRALALLGLGLVAIAGPVVVRRAARRQVPAAGRSGLGVALARGAALAAAFFGVGCVALFSSDLTLPEGAVDHYGYEVVFAFWGLILGAALLFVIGVMLGRPKSRNPKGAAVEERA